VRIKFDFVTNSSTTSFVIWGVSLEQRELLENIKLMEIVFRQYENKGYNKKGLTFDEFVEEYKEGESSFYDFRDLVESLIYPLGLALSGGPDGDYFWVGGDVEKQKDEQTLGDYKTEIINKLKQIGITVNELYYICEAWRDG